MRILVDTETTGLDPKRDYLIEVGWCIVDTSNGCIVDGGWKVFGAPENPCEALNGIKESLVRSLDTKPHWPAWKRICDSVDAIVAHNADFDQAWFPQEACAGKPWVCTVKDFAWPDRIASSGKRLTEIALAMGVGVLRAHRAIEDVLTLSHAMLACDDLTGRLEAALAYKTKPKFVLVARPPFNKKDKVKALGFFWESDKKHWHRTATQEELEHITETLKASSITVTTTPQ